MTLVAIFVALVFLLSLVSGRLERTIVTAPIAFTGAGMVAFLCLPGLRDRQANLELLLQVAEVGLVLLLFTDASRTDLRVLKSIRNLPVRLLSTGMLLTILLGALGALAIFPKLSLWEAGILAVMATVLLSIFAHGLSALPGMDIYARKISALPPSAAEIEGSPAEIRHLTANPIHHPYV